MTSVTSTTYRFALMLTLANGFLDAYTYIARGGVFANVQTANVIFFGIHLSERNWTQAFPRLWPILAFVVGVMVSSHIKAGRFDRFVHHPLRWIMAIQAAALVVIGFVPASVPHSAVTIPLSFLAAMQIGLFRSIGELVYLPVATTGNLMRLVEAGYDGFVDHKATSRHAFGIYAGLTAAFAGGAIAGAFATHLWGVHAIWGAAAVLSVTLVFFIVDEREGKQS